MRAVIFNRASKDISGRAKSVTDQDKDNHVVCANNDWQVVAVFTENNVGASKYSKQLSVKSYAIIEQDLQAKIDALKPKASVGINPLLEEMAGPNAEQVFDKWTLEQQREAVMALYEIKLLPNPKERRLPPEERIVFIPRS